jgi:hypothetical protein
MQFKFVWLPLMILAGVSSVYGAALGTVQDRNLAIAGDLTSRELQCNWCGLCSYPSPVGPGLIQFIDCFTALASDGVACAAAIIELGCSESPLLMTTLCSMKMVTRYPGRLFLRHWCLHCRAKSRKSRYLVSPTQISLINTNSRFASLVLGIIYC